MTKRGDYDQPELTHREITAVGKWFNPTKGFGFVVPVDGGRDVFVSARVLERTGLANLGPEQRVRMAIRSGQKGPAADRIEVV